jgi:hypothetical protein
MRALTATQLLRVWERGAGSHPPDRAVIILSEAETDASLEQLSSLPIGIRDRRLLSLREATFGPQLRALLSCGSCGERLELDLSAAELQHQAASEGGTGSERVQVGDVALEVRSPNSADLIAASQCADSGSAARLIGQRCVVGAWRGDAPIDPQAVPDTVLPQVARCLEDIDPGGDVTLASSCPACGARVEAAFDVASFFWAEIEAEALQLFRDVHSLARG